MDSKRRRLKIIGGFLGAILLAAFIIIPNIEKPLHVSRVKSELRSMATALESYFVDHESYPAMRPLRELCRYHPEELKKVAGYDLSGIEPGRAGLRG